MTQCQNLCLESYIIEHVQRCAKPTHPTLDFTAPGWATGQVAKPPAGIKSLVFAAKLLDEGPTTKMRGLRSQYHNDNDKKERTKHSTGN